MRKAKVAVVRVPEKPSEKEVDAGVRKAIGLVGGLTDIISCGDTVLVKPNLVIARPPETGATTDPRICKAIANIVKEIGARPVIADSSIIDADTEETIQATGYGKLGEAGYEIVDLKREDKKTDST